jgi:hypothetical protein
VDATTIQDYSTLTITIGNGNAVAMTGVTVADPLPTVSGGDLFAFSPTAGNPVTSVSGCGGGTVTLSVPDTAGNDTLITLSDATIAPGGTCTFSVDVSASGPGTYTNVTGVVMSSNAGNGGTATASVTANEEEDDDARPARQRR